VTGPRLGARLWWGALPLLVLLWGTGAILVAALPGLPSTPLVTTGAVAALGFARDVALAITAGAVVMRLLSDSRLLRRWAMGWGTVALGLAAVSLAGLQADISAAGTLDGGTGTLSIVDVVRDSLAGRALVGQALALVAGLVLLLLPGRIARVLALVAVLVAVSAPPMGGHAGLSGPHAAAAVATGLHVAAASVWVGGLAVVCALVLREPTCAPVLLPRFSGLALACVVIVAEAGLLSASLITGSLLDLLGTSYGSIVLGKACLLGWLVWLGWQQRRRAVDRLPDTSVPATLVSVAGVELVVMGTAMGAAVVLTRIGPSPIPGSGFAPLTLIVLTLAVPMLVVLVRPRGWRVSDGLPEAAAVVSLVGLVEVGGVGLIGTLLGPIGVLVELALLIGAGWLAVSSARGRIGGLVVLAVGLPFAMAAAVRLAGHPGTTRMGVVAVLVGEALLATWWAYQRRTASTPRVTVGAVAG
jgi:putative copper export protein